MKIHKIAFKNINSLKGENEISFDAEPLSSAGIFAITGPTGSGKSTILDVITLALFNRIPRFKKAMSKSEIEGMGSVITHHADDASASITYEIHGKRYTSAWSVSKTRTGNLKDYEMFLYNEAGTPMDFKRSEVPAKNEEIIGLKYDQFIKSIILSQGQFAKFLKADKHERAHLLENLTGSYIYRKIGVAAFDKMRQIKSEVTIELDRLENIVCLSQEERSGIKKKIAESTEQQQLIEKELSGLNESLIVKKDIRKYKSAMTQLASEAAEIEKAIATFRGDQSILETYEKLSPLRGELMRYQDAQKVIRKLTEDRETNQRALTGSRRGLETAISSMAELTKQPVDKETFMQVMSAFEKKVTQLNDSLKHIQSRGGETRTRINAKISQSGIALDPKISPADAMIELQRKVETHQVVIAKGGIDPKADTKHLRVALDKLQSQIQLEKEALHLMEHSAEVRAKSKEAKEGKVALEEEVIRLVPLVEGKLLLIKKIEENIALLQRQKQDALLIASLAEHRHHLEDGEPCPLCGSVAHPYTDHLPQQNNEIDQRLKSAEVELLDARQKHQNEAASLTASRTSLQIMTKKIQQLEVDHQTVTDQLASLMSRSNGPIPSNLDQLVGHITVHQEKYQSQKEAIAALVEVKVMNELIADYEVFSNVLAEYKNANAERLAMYDGTDVSRDCNRLQDQFVKSNSTIEALETLLDSASKTLEETKIVLDQSFGKLSPELEAMGFVDVQEASKALISEERVAQLKDHKEKLAERKTSNSTKVMAAKEQLEKALALEKSEEQSLEVVTELISTLSPKRDDLIRIATENKTILANDDQAQQKLKSKAGDIAKLKEKQEKWELLSKMIGDAKGNTFANFAQGLTLQNLLGYANRRLANLSDRYLLDRPFKDGELTVVDQYQGNTHRSVATLSGGESFLISLALALSLSDMASRNVRLESLFIDEGFGTLDQETLDIAMRTLEKLQSESQKTVGVISHVDTLKERINVQIQLEKNAQGYSSISIVA